MIKDLGVTLDTDLAFDAHAHYHLRNISKIQKMLSLHYAEKLVHAFVTSRLDYCNALLSVSVSDDGISVSDDTDTEQGHKLV